MNITIHPGKLKGTLAVPPSKSHAHRLLLAASLAGNLDAVSLAEPLSQDLFATKDCLKTYFAATEKIPSSMSVEIALSCRESGSTLRFLLPLLGVLKEPGLALRFLRSGRLPLRPLSPLKEEMENHGAVIREEGDDVILTGTMTGGDFVLEGGVSSQFITGLLFALPLTKEGGLLTVTGDFASRPYVDMTLEVLDSFGIRIEEEILESATRFRIPGGQMFRFPESVDENHPLIPEGDWSNAAFFLVADALGSAVTVEGLSDTSAQGDKIITQIITACRKSRAQREGQHPDAPDSLSSLAGAFGFMPYELVVDVEDIPDLVPTLCVLAWGTKTRMHIIGAGRLRLKESDRLMEAETLLKALGCPVETGEGEIFIAPKEEMPVPGTSPGDSSHTPLVLDGAGDHRMVMAMAIAATCLSVPLTILGAEAVNKSWPDFFDRMKELGGKITIE